MSSSVNENKSISWIHHLRSARHFEPTWPHFILNTISTFNKHLRPFVNIFWQKHASLYTSHNLLWISHRLAIGIMVSVFANGQEDPGSIPGRVIPKTQKMALDAALLKTLSTIRYGSRVKWSNPGNGIAPFPTPRCSWYWQGSLRVALDYDYGRTSQPPKFLWRNSFRALSTLLDFPPFWIASKQIFFVRWK